LSLHLSQRTPRRILAATLGLSIAVGLAACSSDEKSDSSPTDATAASEGYYPHTQKTSLGDVTIDKHPERIVALNVAIAEELIAVGVEPIAVGASGQDWKETSPWIPEKFEGIVNTDLLEEGNASKVNIESVAALEPDLIISPSYIFRNDDGLFPELNSIAPTITTSSQDASPSWDARLRATAEAVNLSDKAEDVISKIEESYRAVGEKVPGIEQKTWNWAIFTGDSYSMNAGPILNMFGLKPNASQKVGVGTTFKLSLENTKDLDADLLVINDIYGTYRESLNKNKQFQGLPAVQSGAVYYLPSSAVANAVNSGPIALEWLLPKLTPTVMKLAE
jgi:iron complex transport system substrate-binding protein